MEKQSLAIFQGGNEVQVEVIIKGGEMLFK